MKPHVGIVNKELLVNRGGGEINDISIAKELQHLDADVTFVAREPLGGASLSGPEGFDLVRVRSPDLYTPSHRFPWTIGAPMRHVDGLLFRKAVLRKIDGSDFDLLMLTGRPTLTRLGTDTGLPVVYSVRGQVHKLYHRDLSRPEALIAWGSARKVLEDIQVDLPQILPLTPGVNTEQFAHANGQNLRRRWAPDGEKLLLFVGRFVLAKNLTYLIEEFARLKRDGFEDVRLILVGDGPLRNSVESSIERNNLEEDVILPGRISHQRIPEVYRASDCFVLSSTHENFPIVLLEAMAAGLPVVAPAVGGIPEVIQDGVNGLLFDSHHQDGLKDRLSALLKRLPWASASKANKSKVSDSYAWEERARVIRQVIGDVLDG